MTSLELLRVFGNVCCVCETCLLMVFDPVFNVGQHRHEDDASFEIIQFRASQECLHFSHDLDRCVA